MKKLLLTALLIVAVFQLRAQQVPTLRSTDSLFKIAIGGNLKQHPTVLAFLSPQTTLAGLDHVFFENRIPIVVLDGNSKMPIIKLGGYDAMPVKRLGMEGLPEAELKVPPGRPACDTPVK